jgi:hypothetical protein
MTKAQRFVMMSIVLVVTMLALGSWFSPRVVQAARPSVTGTWTVTGSMNVTRNYHSATLLRNAMVLVAGGGDLGPTATAELFTLSR